MGARREGGESRSSSLEKISKHTNCGGFFLLMGAFFSMWGPFLELAPLEKCMRAPMSVALFWCCVFVLDVSVSNQ